MEMSRNTGVVSSNRESSEDEIMDVSITGRNTENIESTISTNASVPNTVISSDRESTNGTKCALTTTEKILDSKWVQGFKVPNSTTLPIHEAVRCIIKCSPSKERNSRKYRCSICNLGYVSMVSVNKHVKRQVTCGKCQKKFCVLHNYKQHLKVVHGIVYSESKARLSKAPKSKVFWKLKAYSVFNKGDPGMSRPIDDLKYDEDVTIENELSEKKYQNAMPKTTTPQSFINPSEYDALYSSWSSNSTQPTPSVISSGDKDVLQDLVEIFENCKSLANATEYESNTRRKHQLTARLNELSASQTWKALCVTPHTDIMSKNVLLN